MSDNGPISGWQIPQEQMRYNAGLRDQKFSIYEGGIRTQSFWRWPVHGPPREITESMGAYIDIVPTLTEVQLPELQTEQWITLPLSEFTFSKGFVSIHLRLASKRHNGTLEVNALVVEKNNK